MKINTTNIQDPLVSGVNIKTLNSQSLLGSGDITISAGGTSGVHILTAPISGRIYAPIFGTSTTTSITAANRMTLVPFFPKNDLRSSSFSINVTVAAAGSLAKVIVTDDSAGNPNRKLFESTDLNCATTGIKTVSSNNFTFTAGTTYWIGIISNQSGATYTAFASNSMFPISVSGVGSTPNYFLNSSTYSYSSVPSVLDGTNFGAASANCAGIWITAA